MKVQSISSELTPIKGKIAQKTKGLVAGVCVGLAVGAIGNAIKTNAENKQSTPVINTMSNENYGRAMINMSNNSSFSKSTVQKSKDFNNRQTLKEQGKTKHWFRAKNGPDKGSKFYRSSEYTFFGYYKG